MSAHDRERRAPRARVRALVRASSEGRPHEAFDAIAVDIARFQAAHASPDTLVFATRAAWIRPSLTRSSEAPAVPTDAFKASHVFAFDEADAAVTFRTSGTTVGARGAHSFRDLGTYDLASVAFAQSVLVALPLRAPLPVLVIGPSPAEMPDTSLSHKFGLFARVAFAREGRDDVGDVLRSRRRRSTADSSSARACAPSTRPVPRWCLRRASLSSTGSTRSAARSCLSRPGAA